MAPRCRPHDPAFSALFMAITIRRYLFPVFHENERAHYDRVQVAVPDISKYYYTEQRLCFLRGDHVSVDKRRSQPSAEKVPVQNAGKQRWRLETQKTNSYSAVPGSRLPGTSGYVGISRDIRRQSDRSFGELGVAGDRASRNSPKTFEEPSQKLSDDRDLP